MLSYSNKQLILKFLFFLDKLCKKYARQMNFNEIKTMHQILQI